MRLRARIRTPNPGTKTRRVADYTTRNRDVDGRRRDR